MKTRRSALRPILDTQSRRPLEFRVGTHEDQPVGAQSPRSGGRWAAVDAAAAGDEIVVTNGTYARGPIGN